jgi:hypothetical protein
MTDEVEPEIIKSKEVLDKSGVLEVETRGEMVKIYASVTLAAASLVIGGGVLGLSAYTGNTDLQTWATGLISGVAGAAIAYGFNGR